MRRSTALLFGAALVALTRSEGDSVAQQARFPPGAIVDPQLYDRPHFDDRPLNRPPSYGANRPPSGNRPYYGDDPYYGDRPDSSNGRPSYQQGRPPYGDGSGRPPYGGGSRPPYGDGRPPYGDGRPPYGDGRPPYGNGRPPYGDGRPPYGSGRPPFEDGRPPFDGRPPYGASYRPPAGPPGFGAGLNDPGLGLPNPLGGLSNALESIARYDEKQCVARMLCEVSAGGRPGSGYYRGSGGLFDLSGLQGVMDLLGAMTASPAASPMFVFGRAALLGATMRDPYRCYRSFPSCPRDPDRLVDYLNNHNGGFFRLFEPAGSEGEQQNNQNGNYPTRRPYYGRSEDGGNTRKGKTLEDEKKENRESSNSENNLVNPRIVNDIPLIADRTGTGDLRLDREQLENPPTTPSRGARNLQFPRSDSVSKDKRPDQLTFPDN